MADLEQNPLVSHKFDLILPSFSPVISIFRIAAHDQTHIAPFPHYVILVGKMGVAQVRQPVPFHTKRAYNSL